MTGDQSSDINHRGLIRRVKLETRVGGAGSVITSICISSLGRGAAVCLSVRQSAPRRYSFRACVRSAVVCVVWLRLHSLIKVIGVFSTSAVPLLQFTGILPSILIVSFYSDYINEFPLEISQR